MTTAEPTPIRPPGPPDQTSARAIVTALLESGNPVRFEPRGPSMRPTLRDGDTVLVHPATARPPRRGDVLLVRRHGRLVLHRMLGRDGAGGIRLAADAALQQVETVPADAVVGVASSRWRRGRERRLDRPLARWSGLLRYALRPLRRLAHRCRSALRR